MKYLIPFLLILISCQPKQTLEKTLNLRLENKIKGFDPIDANDFYSASEVAKIYEGLLEFDYQSRPYKLVPNLAAQMPSVSKDGLTYAFELLEGIKFHPDKCFQNEGERILKAQDVVFSIKRLADPKLKAQGWWMLDGKIKGLNKWRDSGADYSKEIEGVKAIGDYKVEFKLAKAFPQFLYAFAMPISYIVSEKIVNCYKDEFLNHPIGTGPYKLQEHQFNHKILYTKNTDYALRHGHPLPEIEKIVSHIIVEDQPAWLKLRKGEIDFMKLKNTHYFAAVDDKGELKADIVKDKMIIHPLQELDITYYGFNMKDKTLQNKNLRAALSLVFNREKTNALFYKGKSITAHGIIPPGVAGFDPDYRNPYVEYDIEKAREYLKKSGIKSLELNLEILSDTQSRQRAEFYKSQLEKIGLKLKFNINTWPELIKKVNTASAQIFDMSWYADYPDGENFLQLLYGPNKAPGSNNFNYSNPKYDALFEKASIMNASSERDKLYVKLSKMINEDIPFIPGFHRMSFFLSHPWVKNYKPSIFPFGYEKYLEIEK